MSDTHSIKLANFATMTGLELLHFLADIPEVPCTQGKVPCTQGKDRSKFPASLDDMDEEQLFEFIRTQTDNPFGLENYLLGENDHE